MIKFSNVSKNYVNKKKTINILKNINLTINDGEIVGIVGYSGAGKSTLLRLINGLVKIDGGSVTVDKYEINKLSENKLADIRQHLGMIFQNFNLLDSLTVYQNIALSLAKSKLNKDEKEQTVNNILKDVGLLQHKDKYPSELSGGQQQRVGIARAIINHPKYLLCDEATSALDPTTADEIVQLLKKIQKEKNLTIVFISHQIEIVRKLCDRIVVLSHGEIIEDASCLQIFTEPKNSITKQLINNVVFDSNIDISNKNVYQIIHPNSKNDYVEKLNKLLNKHTEDFKLVYTTTILVENQPIVYIYINVIKNEKTLIKSAKTIFKEVKKYE
jgi:D-methionine transport system ATP-binding protein